MALQSGPHPAHHLSDAESRIEVTDEIHANLHAEAGYFALRPGHGDPLRWPRMSGLFLLSWVVAPALMLALFAGVGALLRRLSGVALPWALVLPLGFAGVVVVATFLTSYDATAELAPPAVLALALAGLVLERGPLLALVRRPGPALWALGAAFVAFAVVAAPVVLTGKPGWTGYSRIVDTAHQFDIAAWVATEGRSLPGVASSAFEEVVGKSLGIGYPTGSQSPLGVLARLVSTELAWLYQPYLAMVSAAAALAVYSLLGPVVASRPFRALAGLAAAQANILHGYAMAGGVKELTAACLLLLTAALAPHSAPAERPVRALIPMAVAVAAALASLNLTIVPWLGVLLAGLLVASLWRRRERVRVALAWAALAALTLVVSVPTVAAAVKLAPVAAKGEGSNRTFIVDLGNLAVPVPTKAAVGVWPARDYRYAVEGSTWWSEIGVVVVLLLAIAGLVHAARRGAWNLVALGAAGAVALVYFLERTGPWIQFKAIAITSPITLACAFAGAAVLLGTRARLAGWLVAAGLAVAVLYGNALGYRNANVAPAERMRDLEQLADRYEGQGPALYPAFEEQAEYFLRELDTVSIVNVPASRSLRIRPDVIEARPGLQYAWDVDDFELDYLRAYRLIVRRRSPLDSRPPADWRLVERTRYHEVWRRRGSSGRILFHEPLPSPRPDPTVCDRVAQAARSAAARSGARLTYAVRPRVVSFGLAGTVRPGHWTSKSRDEILPAGPGVASGQVRLPGGRHEVWIQGPFGRATSIVVGSTEVGSLKNRQNYPDQFEPVGKVSVRDGSHTVRIVRGGGNLEPGNAAGDYPIGPLVFATGSADPPVRTAPLSRARSLCERRRRLDWIAVVERSST
jgi:hypothetical protein